MRRWSYILSEAGKGLVRNFSMTVAVVLAVSVSLTLLGSSVLLRKQIERATSVWIDQIEVSVFLCGGQDCPEITPTQQSTLEDDLVASPLVESITYESVEEAYENFLAQFEDVSVMVDTVEVGDLPASFRVKLHDPLDSGAIESQFEDRPGVRAVENQLEVIEPFLRAVRIIQYSALGVAVMAMVAATLLVGNTVRVAAVARRKETQIMKLVGAANWYIRLPFILEGIIAGLIGAAVSWGLLALGVPWAIERMRDSLAFMPLLTAVDVYSVWPWLLIPAVTITSLSSTTALWGSLDV